MAVCVDKDSNLSSGITLIFQTFKAYIWPPRGSPFNDAHPHEHTHQHTPKVLCKVIRQQLNWSKNPPLDFNFNNSLWFEDKSPHSCDHVLHYPQHLLFQQKALRVCVRVCACVRVNVWT